MFCEQELAAGTVHLYMNSYTLSWDGLGYAMSRVGRINLQGTSNDRDGLEWKKSNEV